MDGKGHAFRAAAAAAAPGQKFYCVRSTVFTGLRSMETHVLVRAVEVAMTLLLQQHQ